MAAHAAHLTRTLNDKPSIFEVIAQESLHATIQPALRRVVEFLASLHPARFSWLLRWYDEVYLLLNTLLQYSYIQHCAASFSESLYGLQRVSLLPLSSDGQLSLRQQRLSLLLLTGLPYLRLKLEQLATRGRLADMDGVTPKGWWGDAQKALVKGHALLHLLWEGLSLTQYLAYMSGKSPCPSPLLRLAALTLHYAPQPPEHAHTWTHFWGQLSSGKVNSAKISFSMLGTAIIRSLEVGAFFIQFLKWWEEQGPHMPANTLPIPEPPKLDIRASQYVNKCPICLQKWKNPTALPVSGYVFCYKCVVRALKEERKCPVTKYPCRVEDLIRLYL